MDGWIWIDRRRYRDRCRDRYMTGRLIDCNIYSVCWVNQTLKDEFDILNQWEKNGLFIIGMWKIKQRWCEQVSI